MSPEDRHVVLVRAGSHALASTSGSCPQLVFELAAERTAARQLVSNRGPRLIRSRTLAAIRSYGELEGVQQRLAPLRTLQFHLARPLTCLASQLEGQIERSPIGLRRFIAGAVAGALSKTATAPLEKLRMKLMTCGKSKPLQIIVDTWRQGGPAEFFAGNAADVLRVMPSKAIELYSFDAFKRLLGGKDGAGAFATTLAGALAGLVATTACFPLETVRTRLAVSPRGQYGGIVDCFRVMVQQKGVGSLYQGVSASMIGAVPYSALRFGAYDGLKFAAHKRWGDDIPPHVLVGAGALAGLFASVMTFPLEVVRRRMMAGAAYPNVIAALQVIAAEEGWRALYRGLGVSCIKQAPQTGITLWAYDAAKRAMKA